jgi:hypothetical protein
MRPAAPETINFAMMQILRFADSRRTAAPMLDLRPQALAAGAAGAGAAAAEAGVAAARC